ncbi:hypothetical protein [Desulfosporosinus sp. Sb-LF]|nr:hypothetical protein [Desulfosporosinus sp. Sb-LF]
MASVIPVNVFAASSIVTPVTAGPSALTTAIVYFTFLPPTVTVSV